MIGLRRKIVIALAAIATFALAGAVFATTDPDTVVNFGYDQDSQFFMWNVTSLDYTPWLDAVASDDEVSEPDIDALLEMCGLAAPEGDEPIEYGYTFDGDMISLYALTDTGDFEDEPFDTGGCGDFFGDFVTGPAGQVNHGMFMKTFNSLYDGPHRGCIVRHLAHSNLGKDDQQVKANEDPQEETSTDTETVDIEGSVVFETALTDCLHGKKDAVDEDGAKGGPPAHVLEKFDGNHPKDKVKAEKEKAKGKPEGTPGGRP